ncbi:MAG: sortase [Clostridia bacterium]|nr:sortase [Clostridia bacterium]
MRTKKGYIIKISALAALAAAIAVVWFVVLPKVREKKAPEELPEVTDTPATTLAPTSAPTEIPVTPEPILPDFVCNEIPGRDAFLVTDEHGTFGVADDGSIRFIGRPTAGQNYIRGWADVRRVATNDLGTIALTGDGTLLFTGAGAVNPFPEAEEWTDIVDIKLGDAHIVGLKADGTLVSAGEGAGAEVSSWKRVVMIDAAGSYTAGLTDWLGVKTTLGAEFDDAVNAHRVVAIAAAPDHLAALGEDGKVRTYDISTGEEKEPFFRNDLIKVFAAEGATYAVTLGGTLVTDAPFVPYGVEDVYFVAAGREHAVVLYGSGRAEGFGEDRDLRLTVGWWRLLPYVTDEGWLLGLQPGSEMDGEPVHTGQITTYFDPATGASREAVCVLLGDVNGDGVIDLSDVDAAKAHADGSAPLEGAYLRAANIIVDEELPGSIDVSDIELILKEAQSGGAIDQYAKTDKYTTPLAVARRINPDATGYIELPDTNICYPILYGDDFFYQYHGIDRKTLARGCISYFYEKPTGNIVIAGHNSRPTGTMFHELHVIQDRSETLNDYENRVWYINVYGESGWWEVWAMYEEGAFPNEYMSSRLYNLNWPLTYDRKTDEQKLEWIMYQLERNQLGYEVQVVLEDRFMTLYTCGDDHIAALKGAALYFFLRWVGGN